MEREERNDRFTAIEDQYAGYEVYDRNGEKIGKVDDLFVDEHDTPEYIGVKTGLFGLRSTLIPWELLRVNEERHVIEVQETKDRVKDAPNFNDDEEITPEYEREVHNHFGLTREGTADRGAYGAYYRAAGERERGTVGERDRFGAATDEAAGERHPGVAMGDIDRERGEFREHSPGAEGVTEPEDDLRDEDELRVQRTEEELTAGTREREAGSVNVRKQVRTEREQLRVPKRREEVHVERVPVEGREAPEAEIGDDEVVMPVTEEEVVVEKRPVVKEEIRVRKDVVQDEEVVEEDVRREEVDVDDQTERERGRLGRGMDPDDETGRRGR
jgi:uncharacterized protein (TIGR02271 family)